MRMTGLCTDLYEIRMAVSYLRRGMSSPATFSLFVRDLPSTRGFLVAAGLADCLTFLEHLRFTDEELGYLRDEVGLDESDVDLLGAVRFTGDVWAIPEGRVVFGGEPLLEVTAPIAQAQLVETALLNFITYQTAIASKAARCRIAAEGADVVDFAARRTHGLEAAMAAARASAIAGFSATSYVAAARRYGLRSTGTMAHSYVEAFTDERTAFRSFAEDYPDDTVFLVDTYDTLAGVRAAIEVARGMRPGSRIGVRLDSGELGPLAVQARRMLDDAGLPDARIVASGGLDEYRIANFVHSGSPIDAFGVGTKMGVSSDAPSLDSAYKLVEYAGRPVMKLSSGKVTAPGAKQVFRGRSEIGDLLALRTESAPPDHEPLLVPVMRTGRRIVESTVVDAKARFDRDLAWLPRQSRRLSDPRPVYVRRSYRLTELAGQVSGTLAAAVPAGPVMRTVP
jgi:nicotinate phosphoribosyltransferase